MKKLSKKQIQQLAELKEDLQTAWDAVKDAVEKANEVIAKANDFRAEILRRRAI